MIRVFKWLTAEGGDPKAGVYTDWFTRIFEPKDFSGINKLLMCYLKFCTKLSIVSQRSYLEAYLKVDGKADVKKYNIKTDTMASYDYREISQLEEAYRVVQGIAIATYDNYTSIDLADRNFKVDMNEFMVRMKSELISQALMDTYPHLNDGSDISEVSEELRNDLVNIDKTYDTTKIRDVDLTSNREGADKGIVFLAKTGMPCIDGDIGGIYSTLVYTLTSQPKGGKTRFGAVHFVYPMIVEAKKDAIVYEMELTELQFKNVLIAYHITRVYGGRIKIPDSVLNKTEEMTDEQRQIYESAKIDLFESGKFGKLIFRDELVVEKYQDEIIGITKASGNLGIVMIDYMGLAKSVPTTKWDRRLEEFERIGEAYKITKECAKKLDFAALCINQYNDKGIEAAYAGKRMRSGYVQGGHIVTRHTDYDMHLTYTEEQELANVRSFEAPAVRGGAGFKGVLLSADLSVSIFRQQV